MKIKTGDTVTIIAGKDQFTTDKKGNKVRKSGVVLKTYPKTERVVVKGVNIVSKHEGPSQTNEKGGIRQMEAPIHVSNVALIDPKTNEPTKVGIRVVDGKKVRFAKKSGADIDKVK